MIQLNVSATTRITRAAIEQATEGDAVINVSSGTAYAPIPYGAVYCGTKAFIASFSTALWYEQRERGVYVAALVPGLTESQLHERAGGKDDNRPPAVMWESAERVADALMRGLKRRHGPVIYSNTANWINIQAMRFLTRRGGARLMGSLSKDLA